MLNRHLMQRFGLEFLLVLITAASSSYQEECKCSLTARYFEGSCYSLHLPWWYGRAKHQCEGGGNLTSVKSESVLNFLTSWMSEEDVQQAYIGVMTPAFIWHVDLTPIVFHPDIYIDTEYTRNKTIGYRLLADGRMTCCADGKQYYICQRMLDACCAGLLGECTNFVETNQNYSQRVLITADGNTDDDIEYLEVTEDGSIYVAVASQLKVYGIGEDDETLTEHILMTYDDDKGFEALIILGDSEFLVGLSVVGSNDEIQHVILPSVQPEAVYGLGGDGWCIEGCNLSDIGIWRIVQLGQLNDTFCYIQYTYKHNYNEWVVYGLIDTILRWFTPFIQDPPVANTIRLRIAPWDRYHVIVYMIDIDSTEVFITDGMNGEVIMYSQVESETKDGDFDWNKMPNYDYSDVLTSTYDRDSGMMFLLVKHTPNLLLKAIHIPSYTVSSVGLCTGSEEDQWFGENSLISVHNSEIYAIKGSAIYRIGKTTTPPAPVIPDISQSNRHHRYRSMILDCETKLYWCGRQYQLLEGSSIETSAYMCSQHADLCAGFGFDAAGRICALLTHQPVVMVDNPLGQLNDTFCYIQYTYKDDHYNEWVVYGLIDTNLRWFTPFIKDPPVANTIRLRIAPWDRYHVIVYMIDIDSTEVFITDEMNEEVIMYSQVESETKDRDFEWNKMPNYDYSDVLTSTYDRDSGMMFLLVKDTPNLLLKAIHIPSYTVSSVGLCTGSEEDQWFGENSLISVHNSEIYATKGSAIYRIGKTTTPPAPVIPDISQSNRHHRYQSMILDCETKLYWRRRLYQLLEVSSIETSAYMCSQHADLCAGFGFDAAGRVCALLTHQPVVMVDNPVSLDTLHLRS